MTTRFLLFLAMLLGLTAVGCVDDRMSLEAYGICAMPTTCTFAGKCDAYALGELQYDPDIVPTPPAVNQWLQMGVELRNQLPNNKDVATGRTNTNDAHVTGMRLEISGPASGSITRDIGDQAVPANGTAVVWTYVLPPGTPASPGPPPGSYVVNIVYIGYYDNGRKFETPGFPIAVTVNNFGPFGCSGTSVVTCGTYNQDLRVCGT